MTVNFFQSIIIFKIYVDPLLMTERSPQADAERGKAVVGSNLAHTPDMSVTIRGLCCSWWYLPLLACSAVLFGSWIAALTLCLIYEQQIALGFVLAPFVCFALAVVLTLTYCAGYLFLFTEET